MQSGDVAELCLDGLPATRCVGECKGTPNEIKINGMFAPAELRKNRSRCRMCMLNAVRDYRKGGGLGRIGTAWERTAKVGGE